MADYMKMPLSELAAAVLQDGVIDAKEVRQLRERLYADGKIDRAEADFLFALNDAATGGANDPSWRELFVEALASHVLDDEKSPGALDEAEATYLRSKISADQKIDDTELELLATLCERANRAPAGFQDFVLDALRSAIVADGVVDRSEVGMLRRVIYGPGGPGGSRVERREADLLFDLNDATSGAANDASWQPLFVEAVASHLLDDEKSPGVVDAQEAAWLTARIEGDQQVDANERALLAHLKKQAKGMPELLKKLVETA